MTRREEPLDPRIAAIDPRVHRLRRCGRCSDVMRCSGLTEHIVNSGYAGRVYSYTCTGCGHVVDDLDVTRLAMYLFFIAIAGSFGAFLARMGIDMAAHTASHGTGGNDPAAVYVVVGVMLTGAIPLLLIAGFMLRTVIVEALARRRSPVIAAPHG